MVEAQHIELALTTGSLAWLFSVILTQPGEVFGWWPGLVQRVTRWEPANRLLYGCAKCMAGFWTLWAGLVLEYGWASILCAGMAIMWALFLDRYLA